MVGVECADGNGVPPRAVPGTSSGFAFPDEQGDGVMRADAAAPHGTDFGRVQQAAHDQEVSQRKARRLHLIYGCALPFVAAGMFILGNYCNVFNVKQMRSDRQGQGLLADYNRAMIENQDMASSNKTLATELESSGLQLEAYREANSNRLAGMVRSNAALEAAVVEAGKSNAQVVANSERRIRGYEDCLTDANKSNAVLAARLEAVNRSNLTIEKRAEAGKINTIFSYNPPVFPFGCVEVARTNGKVSLGELHSVEYMLQNDAMIIDTRENADRLVKGVGFLNPSYIKKGSFEKKASDAGGDVDFARGLAAENPGAYDWYAQFTESVHNARTNEFSGLVRYQGNGKEYVAGPVSSINLLRTRLK